MDGAARAADMRAFLDGLKEPMSTLTDVLYTGSSTILSNTFTDALSSPPDSPFDPDVVRLRVIDPSGIETLYTYGVDAELIRDDVGDYRLALTFTESGEWFYIWDSPTSGIVSQGSIVVRATYDESA